MELLKKFKIEAIVIVLNIMGCLLVLCFSGCSSKSELLLDRYEQRNVVKDNDGTQYKVMYKSRFPQGYGCDIFVYKSTDGQNWNKIGTIPSHGYEAYKEWGYFLTRGEDDSTLYFIYIGTGKGKKAVYFSKSLDNGRIWTEPVAVNDDIWAQRSYPKITRKGENIFIAWLEESERSPTGEGRPSGIYLCGSSDGGRSWSGDTWIRKGEDLWITMGEETIYLTYVGGKRRNIIFLSYSKDRGKTWHTETTGELPVMVKEPYITFSGGSIYLIFQGTRPTISHLIPGTKLDYQVYYLKSDDGGKSWSKIIKLKGGR